MRNSDVEPEFYGLILALIEGALLLVDETSQHAPSEGLRAHHPHLRVTWISKRNLIAACRGADVHQGDSLMDQARLIGIFGGQDVIFGGYQFAIVSPDVGIGIKSLSGFFELVQCRGQSPAAAGSVLQVEKSFYFLFPHGRNIKSYPDPRAHLTKVGNRIIFQSREHPA